MEVSGWSMQKDWIEKERGFFSDKIMHLYGLWGGFIDAYGNNDRGYEKIRGNGCEGLLPTMENYAKDITTITSEVVGVVPTAETELGMLSGIEKSMLSPVRELIYETIPQKKEEREGLVILPEDEWPMITDSLSRVFDHMCCKYGRVELLHSTIVDEEPLESVIRRYEKILRIFYEKWDDSFYFRYNIEGGREYSIITFCVVDSCQDLDRQILPKLVETKNPNELLNILPEQGIDNVIFSRREYQQNKIRKLIRVRKQGKSCPTNLLKKRGNREKFGWYVRRLFPIRKDVYPDSLSY